MTTALDVASYIKSRYNLLGEMQMQKLVYYAQAWSVVWDGNPLFQEPIQAWSLGPVVPSLRFSDPAARTDALSGNAARTVDAVIDYYGKMHGAALSRLTHSERPWQQARGDLPEYARSTEEIRLDDMRGFYTEMSIRGEGPKRADSDVKFASDDDVLAVTARNAQRWSGALALLGK